MGGRYWVRSVEGVCVGGWGKHPGPAGEVEFVAPEGVFLAKASTSHASTILIPMSSIMPVHSTTVQGTAYSASHKRGKQCVSRVRRLDGKQT
eukprot:1885635-Pleurochrysis_carterae.AAC.2